MRKVTLIILIFIEFLGIFATEIHYSRYYANSHCAFEIHVPDGIQLTTSKEISLNVDNETIVLPAGTVIVPTYIFPNDVCFNIEPSEYRMHAELSCFKEQEKLNELLNQAEQIRLDEQKPIIQRGFVKGIVLGTLWFVIGTFISWLLLKKNKNKVLFICHAIVSIIIFALLVISALAIV